MDVISNLEWMKDEIEGRKNESSIEGRKNKRMMKKRADVVTLIIIVSLAVPQNYTVVKLPKN